MGKTHALNYFAKSQYDNYFYLNFEKNPELCQHFQGSLAPTELINTLSIYANIDIRPQQTLLIFDEIQQCPQALNSLKYFCEEANHYHIATAGSLLGIKTANEAGFPVGKVNFLNLYPLSFFEFLSAIGETKLRELLENYNSFDSIPNLLHEKALSHLKAYFYTGGMPEVVAEFIKENKFLYIREIQQEILDAYSKNFAKHAPSNQIMNITTIWEQIHRQLAKENKKFIFSAIRKSARARTYEQAIQWLIDAGLIYKSYLVKTPKLPLSSYADDNIFKLFLLDVGLLGAQSHLDMQAIIDDNKLFTEFKGSLTENYVAQQLRCASQNNLYYWASSGMAKIDFIAETYNMVYPLDVKSGNSQKKKSLLVYGEKYQTNYLSRTTTMNLKLNGKIINYPLYLISRFPLTNAEPPI